MSGNVLAFPNKLVVKRNKELEKYITEFSAVIENEGDTIHVKGTLGEYQYESISYYGGKGTAAEGVSIQDRIAECFGEILDGLEEAVDSGRIIRVNGQVITFER